MGDDVKAIGPDPVDDRPDQLADIGLGTLGSGAIPVIMADAVLRRPGVEDGGAAKRQVHRELGGVAACLGEALVEAVDEEDHVARAAEPGQEGLEPVTMAASSA